MMNEMNRDQEYVNVVPSERQMALQSMEFYGFIHFTVNTFTDKEWGDGSESPKCFEPSALDTDQWVRTAKEAGMKGLILTCKHHDGFCLWPTKLTDHSIAASPYKNGQGDIVKALSESLKKEGMFLGIYLSPWDRHEPCYGSGKAYDDFFVAQLEELLSNYGEIFSVWFDGACGEGPNGKVQSYHWDRYYEVIRRLQPNACIHVCGPDIRWCGNEAGDTREAEWSVVPKRLMDVEKIKESSQQADDESFRVRKIASKDQDLGSRNVLAGERDLIWYPAEVNTSIRPGWFYHSSEDDQVKSLEVLKKVYMGSVGGNATFLLNIPPDRRGLFHENDVKRLIEFGNFLKESFAVNLVERAQIAYNGSIDTTDALKKDTYSDYFEADTPITCHEFYWDEPVRIQYIVLKEHIGFSQRVEAFEIYCVEGDQEVVIGKGTVIGYKKIIHVGGIRTKHLKIRITDSRVHPVLSFVGMY